MNTNQPFIPETAQQPSTPVQPSPPSRPREQVISILLASIGVAITLIGVVMLLALAAREGLLTPGVRVAGGALLTAVLTGVAVWVRPRPGGRVGSVAFLATGVAAAFFDVVAVTRIYAWVPLAAGLAMALAVAVAAAWVALVWDEKWLFGAVSLGVAALAPALTGGITGTLVAFLALLQVTGILPELLKGWGVAAVTRTVPVVLAAMIWAETTDATPGQTVAVTAFIAAIGLLGGVATALPRCRDELLHLMIAVSWIPLWTAVTAAPHTTRIIGAAGMTFVAAGSLVAVRTVDGYLRPTLGALAAGSALTFLVTIAQGDWRAMPFFVVAAAGFALHITRPSSWLAGSSIAALAIAVAVQETLGSFFGLFYRGRVAEMGGDRIIIGVVLVVVGVLGVFAARGRPVPVQDAQPLALAGGSAALLGAVQLIVVGIGRFPSTFYPAHLLVTMFALAVAGGILLVGLGHPRHLTVSMAGGLALVGVALLKLVVFDLAYMDAVLRALTFLGAGLVLLVAGTSYARRYAEVARRRDTAGAAPGAAQHHDDPFVPQGPQRP